MPDQAVIFVHERRSLAGQKPSLGVRFDTQIIPQGCYVAALITREGAVGAESWGSEIWDGVVRYAHDVLENRHSHLGAYPEML